MMIIFLPSKYVSHLIVNELNPSLQSKRGITTPMSFTRLSDLSQTTVFLHISCRAFSMLIASIQLSGLLCLGPWREERSLEVNATRKSFRLKPSCWLSAGTKHSHDSPVMTIAATHQCQAPEKWFSCLVDYAVWLSKCTMIYGSQYDPVRTTMLYSLAGVAMTGRSTMHSDSRRCKGFSRRWSEDTVPLCQHLPRSVTLNLLPQWLDQKLHFTKTQLCSEAAIQLMESYYYSFSRNVLCVPAATCIT